MVVVVLYFRDYYLRHQLETDKAYGISNSKWHFKSNDSDTAGYWAVGKLIPIIYI